MSLDLSFLQSESVVQTVRLFALVVSLLHLLWVVVILRQFMSASRMITTATVGRLRIAIFVHILVLAVILMLVIFY